MERLAGLRYRERVVSSHRRHRAPRPRARRLLIVNVVVLALLAGGTAAYASLGKSVTLDVEGHTYSVRTFAPSVESLLEAGDIDVRVEDRVSHDLDASLSHGDEIEVRFAKPVSLVVDGEVEDLVSYDLDVADVYENAGIEVDDDAQTSHDADDPLDRDGETIVVSNPKDVTVVADGEETTLRSSALTTEELLDEADVTLGDDDEVEPALSDPIEADGTVRVVRIEYVERTEDVEIDYETEVRDDDDLFEGETEVLEDGETGRAEQDVYLVLADGEVREREVVVSRTLTAPRPRIEVEGTQEIPEVWDRLAQCESGGNWSINTGNPFSGGLQFLPSTWRSVGGSGLPHENSREEQIRRGMILQERAGWGQWPSCASQLGLR